MTVSASPTVLAQDEWCARQSAHEARVRPFTEDYLQRRSAGRKHPVEDFLFTYYSQKPGQLLRWHPGTDVILTGEPALERAGWKFYRPLTAGETAGAGLAADTPAVRVDAEAFVQARGEALGFTAMLLSRTAARRPVLGCFGMHEWAMAYKSEDNGIRHDYLQLRLGAKGTDELVERSRIRCTHFDAFRFYTPEAVPLNELTPTRENQRDLEQPGCLHANMDLYKIAHRLLPFVESTIVLDCFELAREIRTTDMEASPYDLRAFGHEPLLVETPEGKAEYVRRQRRFAERAAPLRARLLALVDGLLAR